MADIKTKDNAKGTIRTIDKAAVATQRMKQAYIATKEKAERSVNANSSSAEEYIKIVKRLEELEPTEAPEKSVDEFLDDFWKYCEEREREEKILEEFRKQK